MRALTEWRATVNSYKVSFWDDDVKRIDYGYGCCIPEYIFKIIELYTFKLLNFIVSKLHFSKAVNKLKLQAITTSLLEWRQATCPCPISEVPGKCSATIHPEAGCQKSVMTNADNFHSL